VADGLQIDPGKGQAMAGSDKLDLAVWMSQKELPWKWQMVEQLEHLYVDLGCGCPGWKNNGGICNDIEMC